MVEWKSDGDGAIRFKSVVSTSVVLMVKSMTYSILLFSTAIS